MLPWVSLIWGALAFALLIPGFWPSLIGINWLDLPFAAVGLALSVLALIKYKGDNGPALAGFAASLDAVIVEIVRLTIANSPL